ncbi:hypothetical protein VTO42DRAFT_3207 [Malbranchea cinnamomea]
MYIGVERLYHKLRKDYLDAIWLWNRETLSSPRNHQQNHGKGCECAEDLALLGFRSLHTWLANSGPCKPLIFPFAFCRCRFAAVRLVEGGLSWTRTADRASCFGPGGSPFSGPVACQAMQVHEAFHSLGRLPPPLSLSRSSVFCLSLLSIPSLSPCLSLFLSLSFGSSCLLHPPLPPSSPCRPVPSFVHTSIAHQVHRGNPLKLSTRSPSPFLESNRIRHFTLHPSDSSLRCACLQSVAHSLALVPSIALITTCTKERPSRTPTVYGFKTTLFIFLFDLHCRVSSLTPPSPPPRIRLVETLS